MAGKHHKCMKKLNDRNGEQDGFAKLTVTQGKCVF
jgi:hypothetical protein